MTNTNTEIVRQYFQAVADGDLDKLPTLFSPDLIWHQPGASDLSGTYNGLDAVFTLLGRFMERSGGSFRIDSIGNLLANGDMVAVTLNFSANEGGRAMSMAGIDVLRIENGRIHEVWLFSDDQQAEDRFWSGK
ncbi:MAG: nuclear transport factor 2 family protein [Paracoccus sp. (in: a-proteobacteria)]|nr:nuclear transport factor 2 family protein [Paracoccus sp. (in: a-proteobacteria)]